MDALNFEYPDYERLSKGAEGTKRKRVVSVLSRQAASMVKEDEKTLKKRKSSPKPKVATSKKRKAATPEPKVAKMEEETPSTPSAAKVEEILKVMTESLPIKLLSPLGRHLTKLYKRRTNLQQRKRRLGLKSKELLLLCKPLRKRHCRPQHQR
jgi:hypothetical protein